MTWPVHIWQTHWSIPNVNDVKTSSALLYFSWAALTGRSEVSNLSAAAASQSDRSDSLSFAVVSPTQRNKHTYGGNLVMLVSAPCCQLRWRFRVNEASKGWCESSGLPPVWSLREIRDWEGETAGVSDATLLKSLMCEMSAHSKGPGTRTACGKYTEYRWDGNLLVFICWIWKLLPPLHAITYPFCKGLKSCYIMFLGRISVKIQYITY